MFAILRLAGSRGASARAVFEAILPPIASADVDLCQHELVGEVLRVDARACVAQYITSVYTTTPLRNRADAILRALEQVKGVGTLLSPRKDMKDVSAGVLSDLTAFLPLWVKRLQRFSPSKDEWENEHERWLREVVFRADSVGGLEARGRDPLESFAVPDEEHKPRLRTPFIVVLIRSVRPSIALTDSDRDAAIDAMRIAAEKRTEGILVNSRRQHYGRAALVVASCVAFAPKSRAIGFLLA